MVVNIHMFPALYGDSFLLNLVKEDNSSLNFLIDCGFESTFKDYIQPKLEELHNQGQTLTRLIITHLDKDHINGALPLLKKNGLASSPTIIAIDQVWHNTYRHMQSKKERELSNDDKIKLKALITELHSNSELNTVAESDIGAYRSSLVGSLIYSGGYNWNKDFDEKAVVTDNKKSIIISNEVSLRLLSPNKEKLEALEKQFVKELFKAGIDIRDKKDHVDDVFELLIKNREQEEEETESNISLKSYPSDFSIEDINKFANKARSGSFRDNSFGNGSSIAFILKASSKRFLFLADAHPDIIVKELKLEYPDAYQKPIVFDAIKVSHHGSINNISNELLSMIDSEVYLFSTNGKHPKHSHPDLETVAFIISRPLPVEISSRTLYFNYKTDLYTLLDNPTLKSYFNYEVNLGHFLSI